MSEELFWSSEDVDVFRQFLATKTGAKLAPKLAEISVPTLFADGETNRILIRSGEVRGVQLVLSNLYFLAYPPPEPPKETASYPSLTDDQAWDDNEKLNPPK